MPAAADFLSDVFRLIRLSGALTFRFDITGHWYIKNAATEVSSLASVLPPGTDQIIIFHLVNAGRCRMRHPPEAWVDMCAGDIAVLAHGVAHEIANDTNAGPVPFREVLGKRSIFGLRSLRFERGTEPSVQIVCGFLGCSRRAFAPLCASLPDFCKVTLGEPARSLVRYADAEALDEAPGADTLRLRMAEILFMEAMRLHAKTLPQDATGWLAGLRDPLVARALQALHHAPCRSWSVAALAKASGSSRSTLATRFRDVMGESPMHYLVRLRMQLAASHLSERGCGIDAVASEVGYESSAAFQRAFKRCYGMPPAAWRRTVAAVAGGEANRA